MIICAALSHAGCGHNPAEEAYLLGLRAEKGEAGTTDPLACYDRAIALDPHQAHYFRARAGLLLGRGEHVRALADAEKAVSLAPGWNYLYFERGTIKCHLHDFNGALADFQNAIVAQPSNAQFHAGVALASLCMDRPGDALCSIEKAIALAPRFQAAYFQKAVILSRSGNHAAAVAVFTNTLAFTLACKGNVQKDVMYDGEYEFTRAKALSLDELIRTWSAPTDTEYYLHRQ